uniref:Uncharacterized protein n=1 Tax=uncultured prokaryote TaxID=198431 RepID=A0A0H5Q0A2_9ZZZZ|nr:hypothetical protein [uncultured prokaryote]
MDVDLGFLDALSQVWTLFFGFWPPWFQAMLGVALGLLIAALGLKLAKFLKDLFWPF